MSDTNPAVTPRTEAAYLAVLVLMLLAGLAIWHLPTIAQLLR